MVLQTYEELTTRYTSMTYYRQVYDGKNEFFARVGTIYDDDVDFEQWMSLFLNWYLLDRKLPGEDLSPIQHYSLTQGEGFDSQLAEDIKLLQSSVHSLFQVNRALFSSDLRIQDLFTGKNYTVTAPMAANGFSAGEIFEARIVKEADESWHFLAGFCFHPIEVRSFILGEVKKLKNLNLGTHLKLMLDLESMKLKHQRFNHIDVKHIYSFDSRF